MSKKHRVKHYRRKDRPVTATDRYWYQLGFLAGQQSEEEKTQQWEERYRQQVRASHQLVHEMNRIDPELVMSKKISLQKKTVLKMIGLLEGMGDPQGLYLLRVLRQRIKETETDDNDNI